MHQSIALKKLKKFTALLLGCSIGLLCACVKQPQNTVDPFESGNRKTYAVNHLLDKTILKPAALAYAGILPNFVQEGVHNFYTNIFNVPTLFNDVLQGKLSFAAGDSLRLLINTTLGILGFFDVAKHVGLPYHYEDFGMTMAYWGANDSKYYQVPFFGPRTYRDTFGIPVDFLTNPMTWVTPFFFDAVLLGAGFYVDQRAQLLPGDIIMGQSLDPYAFVRNAYLQNREQRIAANNAEHSYYDYRMQAMQQFAPPPSAGESKDGLITVTGSSPNYTPAANAENKPILRAPTTQAPATPKSTSAAH